MVRRANGKVVAETGGGGVTIQSGAQGATIETGGGSIEVRQCNGKVKVSTGGGSVDLSDVGGPAEIETGGGSIKLTSAKGHVHAETGGGGIELYGVPSASAETSAGGIIVKLGEYRSRAQRFRLETGSGDVTVYLASDVAIKCVPASTWAAGTASRLIFRISGSPAKATSGTEDTYCRRQSEWRRAHVEGKNFEWRHLLQTGESLAGRQYSVLVGSTQQRSLN